MTIQDFRKTKIVGTLGPSSVPLIKELMIAGINVFRLNFSHISDPTTQDKIIKEIRDTAVELNRPCAILGDLGGPKVRCNAFDTPTNNIQLVTNETVSLKAAPLNAKDTPGTDGVIMTPLPETITSLKVGDRVLLDDGALVLKVVKVVSETELSCQVLVGGTLKPKKGLNVPDSQLQLPALTEKDKRDAKYMFEKGLDYVALSFVQKADDVRDLIKLFEECQRNTSTNNSWRPHIVSKIEKPQAFDDIDEIIKASDAIMVARGDLGVECSIEEVPVLQKMLISKANAAFKPVITATQMLESMTHSPSPTRAEVSDVANAVLDRTDAVMLSGECAVGDYPVETVRSMSNICKVAEANTKYCYKPTKKDFDDMIKYKRPDPSEFSNSIVESAVAAANNGGCKALIVFTSSGDTASFVSKWRPPCQILAVTSSEKVYRQMNLFYGVKPVLSDVLSFDPKSMKQAEHHNSDWIIAQSEHDILACREKHLQVYEEKAVHPIPMPYPEKGDFVVFCSGYHEPFPGLSNSIKMAKFGQALASQTSKTNLKFLATSILQKKLIRLDQ